VKYLGNDSKAKDNKWLSVSEINNCKEEFSAPGFSVEQHGSELRSETILETQRDLKSVPKSQD
jgi:hypothetical protein